MLITEAELAYQNSCVHDYVEYFRLNNPMTSQMDLNKIDLDLPAGYVRID